mmetsp:Transcript_25684/g.37584  ORF Transcript_25684/g.37584 Transcript_25684/m.37584 type:complete len:258 (+) Transcript_25684:927-1700(+)
MDLATEETNATAWLLSDRERDDDDSDSFFTSRLFPFESRLALRLCLESLDFDSDLARFGVGVTRSSGNGCFLGRPGPLFLGGAGVWLAPLIPGDLDGTLAGLLNRAGLLRDRLELRSAAVESLADDVARRGGVTDGVRFDADDAARGFRGDSGLSFFLQLGQNHLRFLGTDDSGGFKQYVWYSVSQLSHMRRLAPSCFPKHTRQAQKQQRSTLESSLQKLHQTGSSGSSPSSCFLSSFLPSSDFLCFRSDRDTVPHS